MDKSTDKTHDFMNVDSFSQLPFVRPAPPVKVEKGIRLFGIEFVTGDPHNNNYKNATTAEQESSNSSASVAGSGGGGGGGGSDGANASDLIKENDNNNPDNSRKFECHYCCRNFPTSQALGGHQNAHKRERQHAKRAHLQSTMAHNSTITDGHHPHHLYGLLNYGRFGTSTASSPPTLTTYPSWNYTTTTTAAAPTTTTTTNGFSHHNQQQRLINGSQLPLWKISAVHQNNNKSSFSGDRQIQVNHHLPYFASDDRRRHQDLKSMQKINGSSSQNAHVYESKASVQDHVSLDLRL